MSRSWLCRAGTSGSRARGFTLIELMLVVVIIGILAAIVLPRLGGQKRKAQIEATKGQIAALELAIGKYEIEVGEYPKALQDLVQNPGVEGWEGPYLQRGVVPADGFGQPFTYKVPGEHNTDYDLISKGPDGTDGTPDDIANYTLSTGGRTT